MREVLGAPRARFISSELVGRDVELGTIAHLVGAVASGSTRTVLISGEAGLGKTALLGRTIEMARRAGLRVLRGDCVRFEMSRAFGPFLDALRPLRHEPAASAALAVAPPAGDIDTGKAVDRYRRHGEFVRAFRATAEQRPLVLAIDDLHWADESTLELFAHLSRRLPDGMLLVGSYRPEEAARRAALRRSLGDIPLDRRTDLMLRRLTASEVGRALRLMLGPRARLSTETREILQARSTGNPLFLEEMLRALAQRGELRRVDEMWHLGPIREVPLPESVQDAVRERFAGLDAGTRELALVAATIGERFELGLVAAAAEVPPAAAIDAVRGMVIEQLVVEEHGEAGDAFVFRHPLIPDALLSGLLGVERRDLHRRVAAALERSRPSDEDAAALAYHWDEAGERARAFEQHRRAGEHEARRFAHAAALRHFERALELANDDAPLVGELSMRAVAMARVLARAGAMLTHATRAAAAFERIGDQRALGPALIAMQAGADGMLWPRTERRKLIERAFAVLEPLGESRELANAHTVAAIFEASEAAMRPAASAGRIARALEHAEHAVAIAERCHGDREVAHWGMALVHVLRGDRDGAIAAFRRGVAACGDDRIAGPSQINNFNMLADLIEQASGTTEEVTALRRRSNALRERYGVMQTFQAKMHHLFLAGDWDEYLRVSDDHADDPNESASVLTHQALHRSFIEVARAGEVAIPAARAAYARVLRSEDVSETDAAAVPEVALLVGDHAWALEATERAAELVTHPHPYGPFIMFAGVYGVLAAREAGDDAAATRWLARFPAEVPAATITFNMRVVDHTIRYGALERDWSAHRLDAAIDAVTRLIDQRLGSSDGSGRTTLPGLGIWPMLTHFLALREIDMRVQRGAPGDTGAAAARLAWIVEFYRKGKAPWYLERLRERAARWRIAFPDDALVHAPVVLTGREREVALLVANGLTNRQIAERLTLSVRTAESHVDGIRAKLGVRTRAQIAAWVTEREVARM